MPELVEVEAYRALAERTYGRTITGVELLDPDYGRGRCKGDTFNDASIGGHVSHARRHGKLLVLDVEDRSSVGLRFGMTGRLIVDGAAAIDELLYSSVRDDPAWDRFVMHFSDGGSLRLRDPRRLGSVELDPDVTRLGPDARTVTRVELAKALRGTGTALKVRLLDQQRIAGIGNLLGDEILWRAGLAPTRAAESVRGRAVTRLHEAIGDTVEELIERGGSHLGELMPERRTGGRCPRDGVLLARATVGGRSTWWCPRHQH